MVAPSTTTWVLDPHSRAKHAILQRYLLAWTAILAQGGFPRFAYVDGFAGPGRYVGGEKGSPIIAIEAALAHRGRITSSLVFFFVERDEDRRAFLREEIQRLSIPPNLEVRVADTPTFEQAFGEFRALYSDRAGRPTPTFAFLDPFGWTGIPFHIVAMLLAQRGSEVLVTFMYEEMNRFISLPEQENNFDSLFGTRDWRKCVTLRDAKQRNRCLHDTYLNQLKTVAKHVRSFQMKNEAGVTDYYLFFGTNHLLGFKRMKEAMWKVDPGGEFTFSDATDPNQLVMLGAEPNWALLQKLIVARFEGSETAVGAVEEFVVAETGFRETHYKRVLRSLELSDPPSLTVVDPPPSRRPGRYASPALRLRFS